jgi:RNA polymerase sigma-70 factor (ECF subfamily)
MSLTSEQLWLAMRDELAGFFRRRVAEEHAVEDLISETFLRVHAGLNSVQDEDRVSAWVYRVARNVLGDHRRSARTEVIEAPERVDESSQDPENFNAEVNSWLEGYLNAQLSAEHREAVELADVQGLSQPEIAARLGLSLPALKSRVQRGRHRLRELVDACCHVEFDRHQNVVGYQRRAASECCRSKSSGQASC